MFTFVEVNQVFIEASQNKERKRNLLVPNS